MQTAQATQDPTDLIDVRAICAHTGYCADYVRRLLHDLVRDGRLAPPVRIRPKSKLLFPRGEVLAALTALRGERGCVRA